MEGNLPRRGADGRKGGHDRGGVTLVLSPCVTLGRGGPDARALSAGDEPADRDSRPRAGDRNAAHGGLGAGSGSGR